MDNIQKMVKAEVKLLEDAIQETQKLMSFSCESRDFFVKQIQERQEYIVQWDIRIKALNNFLKEWGRLEKDG